MDYREYEAEDFLLDPLFRDYCLGKNEEAINFWEEWLTANPGRHHAVRQARQLYALLNGNHGAQGFLADEKAFRARFARHVAGEAAGTEREASDPSAGPALKPASKLNRYYAGAVAASVVVVLCATLITRRTPTRSPVLNRPAAAEYVQTSKAGERKSFQLPDGSKVMLNAGSTLRVPADFNRSGREISLEGEAFFDVARDPRKPFVIHTPSMDIRVLGTSFNIKAYPGDAQTEASLLTGSVEVLVKDGRNKKFILHPSEKIIVPNSPVSVSAPKPSGIRTPARTPEHYTIERLSFSKTDSSLVEISWTESRLAFNDDSFEEIARQLERWYNVSIRFEDGPVKQFRFTATFDKKTITQVLNALQLSRPFSYRMEEADQIVIGGPVNSQ